MSPSYEWLVRQENWGTPGQAFMVTEKGAAYLNAQFAFTQGHEAAFKGGERLTTRGLVLWNRIEFAREEGGLVTLGIDMDVLQVIPK
jgi:hypothetical protein